MQVEVFSARFLHGSHDYYFSPNGLDIKKGEYVIVDTEKGKELVRITREVENIDASNLEEPLKNAISCATEEEIKRTFENDEKAARLLPDIKAIVRDMSLDMKVISVEAGLNNSKIIINFTSDNRVDFRELVKTLAEKFKMRVELRQIGPRDATRLLGGLGECGKECCCHQGICGREHVSIKMAKNQGLSLNPNNISGLCGKLLCCLAYENPYYVEVLKEMPKVGSFVKTQDGEGKVVFCDLLKKVVDVKFQNENSSEIKKYSVKDIKFKKNEN